MSDDSGSSHETGAQVPATTPRNFQVGMRDPLGADAPLGLLNNSAAEAYVFRVDDGRLVAASRGALQNTGYSQGELSDLTFLDLTPRLARETFATALERLRSGAATNSVFETAVRRRDGSEYEVEVYLHVAGAEPDRGVVALVADLTAQREAARLATAMESRLRAILDGMFAFVSLFDVDGTVRETNQYTLDQWKMSREEMIGRRPWETERWARDPAAVRILKASYARVARGNTIRTDVTTTLTDGRSVTTDTVLRPIFDEKGDVVAIHSFAVDVTARNDALQALQKSQSRLLEAQRIAQVGDWELDFDTNQMKWSDEVYRILEVDPTSFRPTFAAFAAAFNRDDQGALQFALLEAGSSVLPNESMFRLEVAGGRVKHVRLRCQVFRLANGAPFRSAGTIQDVTRNVEAEAERRTLEQQLFLSQKLEAVGALAGGIAHDFNNILAAISGNAELLKSSIDRLLPEAELIDDLWAASLRAKDLVRQILAFTRPQETQRAAQDVRPIISEALRLIRATVPASVRLEVRVGAEPENVVCDSTQIHQVIVNLCTNAWHAIEGQAGWITVAAERVLKEGEDTIAALVPGCYVCISVSDNGKGMDSTTLERIFDPFFTTKSPEAGTGLGLAVVQRIVTEHLGAIEASSTPGEGTTFRVYLPAAPGGAEPPAEKPAAQPTGRGARILFVDDEQSLTTLAERMLDALGYVTTGTTSPMQALATFLASPESFDGIIADMNMPGGSGIELVQKVREIRPALPAVITSGDVTDELRDAAAAMGGIELLQKPASMAELAVAIDRALGDRGRAGMSEGR